jgi:glutamate--cysteine ligase
LTSKNTTFAERLKVLNSATVQATLPGIKHGVEREALRINQDGSLAQTPHPSALGSALTHEYITTDFSESLLEFITPPELKAETTMGQLQDIHKYVQANIGEERLWPTSMPCYVNDESQIPIANYGTSNVGKMKSLYRVGLKNRYGSMMQAIAGVHFNFSLPENFWQAWLNETESEEANKDNISAAYFGLVRNYRRVCWLIPYLYGASPALCGSFIKGKKTTLPFKKLGKGTYYLPYATSLRMSDLGYTNSAQSDLAICYNKVDTYIESLRTAINTPSEDYRQIDLRSPGTYQQLNANVLQIENELYSPIRPKQPTLPLEKPTDALAERGVSYIEVRALDVNPFSEVGIEIEQFYFLDVFLLYCLVSPSEFMDAQQYHQTEVNLGNVVTNGRDPALRLDSDGTEQSIRQWAGKIFEDMKLIADSLDDANQTDKYSKAVAAQQRKVENPELTLSAKLLSTLLETNQDNGAFGLELAQQYKESLADQNYHLVSERVFIEQAGSSLAAQKAIEDADSVTFDVFLKDYFKDLKGSS